MLCAPKTRRFLPFEFEILVTERTGFEPLHPGGNPGTNLKSISHRYFLREVAFEWELTSETIYLPQGCLQGGDASLRGLGRPPSIHVDHVQGYRAHKKTQPQ